MKKLFILAVLLNILFVSACSNISTVDEIDNDQKSFEKISFDITYQELLQTFAENNFQYSENGVKSFDNDEKLINGVIYMSENEFEICRVKVRTFNNRVAQIHLNYDISGDETGYDKFPKILKAVAHSIKSDLPDSYIEELEKYSGDFYSRDYDDLRISISYSDKYLGTGVMGIAIDCAMVHLDFVD